ncbi:hypothetical protein [Pyrobaculum aerophilum]|uniref:hypothetical protein n=1 Tax=Pyrobaculum aerophilum TaxID=13773 RepID=UPI002FDB6805
MDLSPFPKAVTWVKLFGEFVYCPSCGGLAYLGVAGVCGVSLLACGGESSLLRGVLLEGLRPPSVVMRPEVYDVVVKWWRVYRHPFVSVKYLRSKEEALEVL